MSCNKSCDSLGCLPWIVVLYFGFELFEKIDEIIAGLSAIPRG